MKIGYRCSLLPQEEKGYLVQFPDFEEAVTEGETLEEAVFNAEEVLSLTLEGRMEEGILIPRPIYKDKSIVIYPSPRIQAALLVRFHRGDHSFSECARALETSWPSAARFEDPHYWSTLRQLDKMANILGKKLVLSFEDHENFL